jgi:hypothetical protein
MIHSNSVNFIINIVYIILSFISLVGLVSLTKFAFNAKSTTVLNNTVTCVDDIDETQLSFCKVTTVVLWTQIVIFTLFSLFTLWSKYQ